VALRGRVRLAAGGETGDAAAGEGGAEEEEDGEKGLPGCGDAAEEHEDDDDGGAGGDVAEEGREFGQNLVEDEAGEGAGQEEEDEGPEGEGPGPGLDAGSAAEDKDGGEDGDAGGGAAPGVRAGAEEAGDALFAGCGGLSGLVVHGVSGGRGTRRVTAGSGGAVWVRARGTGCGVLPGQAARLLALEATEEALDEAGDAGFLRRGCFVGRAAIAAGSRAGGRGFGLGGHFALFGGMFDSSLVTRNDFFGH
jgi:hypothetical protein